MCSCGAPTACISLSHTAHSQPRCTDQPTNRYFCVNYRQFQRRFLRDFAALHASESLDPACGEVRRLQHMHDSSCCNLGTIRVVVNIVRICAFHFSPARHAHTRVNSHTHSLSRACTRTLTRTRTRTRTHTRTHPCTRSLARPGSSVSGQVHWSDGVQEAPEPP